MNVEYDKLLKQPYIEHTSIKVLMKAKQLNI